MKIEAEVHNSLYSFTSAESKCGGGGNGCSVSGGELPPIAQDSERSSIGRPERQLTPPGCGGCGSSTLPAENQNNRTHAPHETALLTSVFDCEHFQFIDDDEEDDAEVQTTPGDVAAPAFQNGTNSVPTAPPRGHLPSEQQLASRDEHPSAEVSVQPPTTRDTNMSNESARATAKGHAVKRQVSFEEDPNPSKTELKSLLKKSNRSGKKKGRVTFNEAVTLYSDESEHVQLLALTTGPDIVCTEVFYMFEPPIEYQDVPPFEPPAEYRDSDALPEEAAPVESNKTELPTECVADTDDSHKEAPCNSSADEVVTSSIEDTSANQPVSTQSDNGDSATEKTEIITIELKDQTADPDQMHLESTKESDKLFERFLEAEREFAVDEELNSVFHELDSDFANDGKNGSLDDNFFRKLITLLSSAEGDPSVQEDDIFTSNKLGNLADDNCHETEDEENSQTHSRTLSEADSDCSISSQDTIIVRLGEDENDSISKDKISKTPVFPNKTVCLENSSSEKGDNVSTDKQECYDEVFNDKLTETDEKPRPLPRESLVVKNMQLHQAMVKLDRANEETLSRQSSGEQSVNSGTSQDPPQDADDSTSSDSRSGEVEEEIRLDDIGYDEEDADDYDEESFRGMAHGNSKIRRIIKKNALQCTLFRGIEAKRRQQPGAKYPRPKSPLLSQESLVEKLKWLTTIDEQKDADNSLNFHSKPPDVILSTGGIPVNGNMGHGMSSEDDIHNQSAMSYQQQQFYQMQRFAMPPNTKGGYYVRHDGYHPSLPRQRASCPGHVSQMASHNMQYPPARMVTHPAAPQVQWQEQRNMTVPRNFRDWRVIQRVMVNRNGEASPRSQVPADYVRCANGNPPGYSSNVPPDVSRTSQPPRNNKDELEQFVEQDSKRLERIRKRYSLAEEDDDPTFGFARRPSVRGVQRGIQPNPSDVQGPNKLKPYVMFEDSAQGQALAHSRTAAYNAEQMRAWNRDPNWRQDNSGQSHLYSPPSQSGRSQMPMHIHRASVALTELPGNATIPYTHRKPHPDPRYHSYAESMYGSTRTLPTKGWVPPDPRSCHNVSNPAVAHPMSNVPLQAVSPQMLQVPPHPVSSKDERGVPEGASSSPKISSDSLYHSPVPDSIASGGPHKDDGVIYYSLNV